MKFKFFTERTEFTERGERIMENEITTAVQAIKNTILRFNRELNCLVAVELKKGEFKPSYLGQL